MLEMAVNYASIFLSLPFKKVQKLGSWVRKIYHLATLRASRMK
jgi:hypothetical protein